MLGRNTFGGLAVKWLMILLVLCCGACSNSKSAKDFLTESKGDDVTDRSSCKGEAPTHASLLNQTWTAHFRTSTGVDLERTLWIETRHAVLTARANYRGESEVITARSLVHIAEAAKTIEFQSSDSVLGKLDIGDNRTFDFSIEITPQTIRYEFVGPCLKITAGSDETIFVPGY